MKKMIAGFAALACALLSIQPVLAYYHSNRYGGSTSHSYGSTTHTSYAGTSTTHTYGEGTSHTGYYGGTTSHSYSGGTTYSGTYYGYHPPTTGGYYGCYDCAHWGAAAAGVVVGASVASANSSAAASNAYAAGYSAGSAATAYAMGETVVALPSGCKNSTVGSSVYYVCGSTWFSPAYGANGVYYRVVPAP